MATPVVLTAAVEGPTDAAVLRKICSSLQIALGDIHGRNGKKFLLSRLKGYNHSAHYRHWIVLIDLDREECAPEAAGLWLPIPAALMCFRIAVREAESWLLADPERLGQFLGVSAALIPAQPDELENPKQELLNVVRRSPSRAIREDMLPLPGSGHSVGPAYVSRIIEFVLHPVSGWRPINAAALSNSLGRCIEGLRRLASRPYPRNSDEANPR